MTRLMSSYEWKNMSKQAQQANKDFGELSKKEIRKAGEEEIDRVEKALKAMEPFNDVFEVRGRAGRGDCVGPCGLQVGGQGSQAGFLSHPSRHGWCVLTASPLSRQGRRVGFRPVGRCLV